jgi:pimeloyl-ACP methyl ester carboxylesterase
MVDATGDQVRLTSTVLHGHRVAYRVAGDPSLPVLVLLHGLTSSSATWEPVMPALAEQAHVIAPDLLGHGSSDKPAWDYSLGAFAAELRDLLEKLGHASATVVGHSFGGGVALQFAYQYPEYTDRLVLVDSGGLGREVSWVLRAAALPGAEFVLPLVAHRHLAGLGASVAGLLSWAPVRPSPSVLEAARGYASLSDLPTRRAFVHTLRSVIEPGGQRVSASDRLYLGAARPVLIVWGALDSIIPVSHARTAHEAVPGSQLDVFEQAGHFPHRDEPERFARTLTQFLASTEPAPVDRATMRERLNRGGHLHGMETPEAR